MKRYLYNLATDKSKGLIAGLIKVFLFLLSLIYGAIVRALIFFNRIFARRLSCKVISVGNITLGGTGKTSLVEFICRYLRQQDHKVAVLSRGYKRRADTPGDEPGMLLRNLGDIPVIVDKNRIRGAKRAMLEYKADTVVLDDGFQQWKIKKDLEIVTVDATRPFGNRHMLPRGILREPLSSLKRADIFVLTKTNLNPDTGVTIDTLKKLNPGALIVESIHQPVGFYDIKQPEDSISTGNLKGKAAAVFSGIGDPESFENLIMSLGIKIGLSFRFQDHHHYTQEDLDKIIKSAQGKFINTVMTTEKDAARLHTLHITHYTLHILVLRIQLAVKNEERFFNRLLSLYSL